MVVLMMVIMMMILMMIPVLFTFDVLMMINRGVTAFVGSGTEWT